jgi:SPP1 family predicted phage head-tail adaptor
MIEDHYDQTVYIQKLTTGSSWGVADAWSDSSTILAAMNPVSGRERFAAEKEGLLADYKMFCGTTVTLDESRRVKWNDKTYNVIFVKDTLNKGHHLNAMLKRTDT